MQGSLRYEFFYSHFKTVLPYLAVLRLALKIRTSAYLNEPRMEDIETFHAHLYLVFNGGQIMHA
jgi:hypothetical protein